MMRKISGHVTKYVAIASALLLWGNVAFGSEIPELNWTERSDWINVKTDITTAAMGDGVTDDTPAIQAALDTPGNGITIYFPPGTYRITNTLVLTGGNTHYAVNLVGHGRSTRLKWDGAAGGNLFHINGNPYSRYEGLNLDGQGVAACGFYVRNTQKFETSIRLKNMGFNNFTGNGLYAVTGDSFAMAETSYENCVFRSCARGVTLGGFNDYDHTFSGCDFIDCGYGIYASHGTFYARDCFFSGSTSCDIYSRPEHGCSVRRCKSVGSARFIDNSNSVSPFCVQDCYVDGWTGSGGAIVHSSLPSLLLSHTLFVHPPDMEAQVRCSAKAILCDNAAHSSVFAVNATQLYSIPAGSYAPLVGSTDGAAITTFVDEDVTVPSVVFDAKVDFGAVGNGFSNDTVAIQNTINAARAAANGAIAYIPLGTYKITSSLTVTGSDYVVGGCGYFSRLRWDGAVGGTIMTVTDPDRLRLENIMIGHHDLGTMVNAIDVEQNSTSNEPSRMTYDGVELFGKYQSQPENKGLYLNGLGTNCTVVLNAISGNLRLNNCADATIIGNVTYEGAITVNDTTSAREGFLGIQTRLSTLNDNHVILRDNTSIVMSDFYTEQGGTAFQLSGSAGDPPGRVVVQEPKIQFNGDDPQLMTITDYEGQIFCCNSQMYVLPPVYSITQTGTRPAEVVLFGNLYYNSTQEFSATNASLFALGNRSYGTGAAPPDNYTPQTLSSISLAMDDLQKLGWFDLKLNHAHVPLPDTPSVRTKAGNCSWYF